MRIGIDARPVLGERGGVGWHTYHLLRALLDLKEDVEFLAYVPGGVLGRLHNDMLELEHRSGLRWVEAGRATMRWRGSRDRLDLFHGTNFKMQTQGTHGGVVTIHDLWLERHPEFSPKFLGQRVSFYRTRRTTVRARMVITVSEHSAREIESLYGVPRGRIAVIPNGVSDEFRPSVDSAALADFKRRYAVPTEQFILFVGGADPRKNHRTLLRAYASQMNRLKDYSLVMVGDSAHRFGNMKETARACGLEHRVVCTERLSLLDLRLLYSHAAVFVFPSLHEGFGMPVLEAMACGAPVITTRTTSLPEVVGAAALLVDPDDADELGEAIVRMLEEGAVREEFRARGFERAKQFTWETAARQTLAIYREVCGVR